MSSYYYLIAGLPELQAQGELPITYSDFLAQCRGNVSEGTYRKLEALSPSSREGAFLSQWAKENGSLMAALNERRMKHPGRSARYTAETDINSQQLAETILSAENPMAAEKMLLAYQFELLDSLVGLHSFDDYVLFGYALKLKLLQRQNSFDRQRGKAEFSRILDTLQQRVYDI